MDQKYEPEVDNGEIPIKTVQRYSALPTIRKKHSLDFHLSDIDKNRKYV